MRGPWRVVAFGGSLAAMLMLAAAAGCGDNDDDGGGDGGGGGGGGGGATPPSPFNLEVQGVEFPQGGAPAVTFRVTDQAGAPIDLAAEMRATTGNRITPIRMTLSQLTPAGDYVDWYERDVAGKRFTTGDTTNDPAAATAKQAVFDQIPTDQTLEQRLTAVGNGVYRFQMSAPTRTDLDRGRTHTFGMWATRTLAAEGDAGHPASATFNFTPGGGATSDKFETVSDAACNTCHGRLEAHDRRTGTQLCITCHSPQSTDPETGNTVDMKVMIHKIHMGASLPSVQNGQPYRIVGFAPGNPETLPETAVHDYSQVVFPRAVTDCATCHQGEDGERWRNVVTTTACLSCHDNVRLDGSAGNALCGPGVTTPCNHRGGNVGANANCVTCHGPNEITAMHQNPLTTAAAAFRYELVSFALDATRKPVVRFRVVNPSNNTPYDIKTHPAFTAPQGASSLTVDVAWQTNEFSNDGSGAQYGQPIAMNALTTATAAAGQAGVWEVTTAAGQGGTPPAATIPEGVQFVTVMIEGHPALNGQRIPVTTLTQNVAVTGGGGAPDRRTIVSTDKCNACHGWLTAHGANRNNNVLACAICHNANGTDKRRRPAGVEGEESIDFKVMIHEVHAVGVRENDVTIYGFGNTPHVFPIGLGNVANCNVCHVGTSYMPPLAEGVLDTTLSTGADPVATNDNTRRPKTQAACLACHDSEFAVGHAQQMTVNGVESCQNCHGANQSEDVSKVHPVLGD